MIPFLAGADFSGADFVWAHAAAARARAITGGPIQIDRTICRVSLLARAPGARPCGRTRLSSLYRPLRFCESVHFFHPPGVPFRPPDRANSVNSTGGLPPARLDTSPRLG